MLGGRLPKAQQRLVEAWVEIHRAELHYDWDLFQSGQLPVKIETGCSFCAGAGHRRHQLEEFPLPL